MWNFHGLINDQFIPYTLFNGLQLMRHNLHIIYNTKKTKPAASIRKEKAI